MSYHGLFQGPQRVVLREKSPTAQLGIAPSPIAHLVHETLRGWVLNGGFPCNGAKTAFNTNSYRLGIYETFSENNVQPLADDLIEYIAEYGTAQPPGATKAKPGEWVLLNRVFATFLACFKEKPVCDESTFEIRLWSILEKLRTLDKSAFPTGFSKDPADNNFAFCFGGEAFFVAAFHPGSWRWSRRFMLPLIVFNMHKQFDGLKTSGAFDKLRDTIRKNDDNLQGCDNDLVSDFGDKSEAPQYAMRRVPNDWKPPGYSGR